MNKAAPWSFSKLKAFETCPKQFYHEKVLKEYPFVQTDAIIYGNEFHKACENYIGDEEPLPEKFMYVKDALDTLNGKRGIKLCEKKLGITADLEPCDFYDRRVWFRGIADLLIVDVVGNMAWVVDYKTGKSAKYADKGQLELMALSVFSYMPKIDTINAGLLFVSSKVRIFFSWFFTFHPSESRNSEFRNQNKRVLLGIIFSAHTVE